MANAAITEPELKSYYVAPIGESGTIQLDNSEHGTITIRPDTPIQGRANGDPVIHGTYTVEYNSIGSHFEYKVDTNSSYKITAAYDLDYTTVHEILSHSLTHTSTMASLKIEFKYFSVAGTANAYLNFVIRNGKIYVETNMWFQHTLPGDIIMEKLTGILLLIAVAFRLLVLFFFSQSIFLTQLSISTFIVVMIIAIILLIRKWLHWRNSK